MIEKQDQLWGTDTSIIRHYFNSASLIFARLQELHRRRKGATAKCGEGTKDPDQHGRWVQCLGWEGNVEPCFVLF